MPEYPTHAAAIRPSWIDTLLTILQSVGPPIEDEENEGYFDGTSEYFDADDADDEDDEDLDPDEDDRVVVDDDEDDLG
ncbi:MAG: hypothetical protein QF733_07420 [Phycisphaerales bacterium]|jgi:hypothetical protein|nr:hypothetical protein [Phycisphaerales bacterium]